MGTYLGFPGQTACTVCPAGTVSGAASTAKSMCTYNGVDVEVSSNIAVNLTTFRRLEGRILSAYATVLGLHRSAVKLLSAREIQKSSGFFRRLLFAANMTNITQIDVQVTVPLEFVEQSLKRLQQNLTAYMEAHGLPTTTLSAILQTCGAGAEPKSDTMKCGPCSRGFYKFKSDNTSCLPCNINSSTVAVGAILLERCVCNAGYYSTETLGVNTSCLVCGLGHFCIGNQSRSVCPVGTYGSAPTLPMRSSCRLCPARTTSLAGSEKKTNCSCDKGYTGPDFSACEACAAGFYKPVVGDEVNCTACVEGKYLDKIASKSDNCSSCRTCRARPSVGSGVSTVACAVG